MPMLAGSPLSVTFTGVPLCTGVTPLSSQPATPLAEAVCPPTVVTLKVINKVSFET